MRRQSNEVKKEDMRRILDDPVFQQVIGDEETTLVTQIANMQHDGSDEANRIQKQLCDDLRAITRVKRRLFSPLADLREVTDE